MRQCLALGASGYRIEWMFLQAATDAWQRLIFWFSAAGTKKAEIKETPVRTSVCMQAEEIMDGRHIQLFFTADKRTDTGCMAGDDREHEMNAAFPEKAIGDKKSNRYISDTVL